MSNIFIGLKKTCLGVLERGERDNYNETGLKEGGGIEMSTTVLHYAMHALLRFVFTYPPNKPIIIVGMKIIMFKLNFVLTANIIPLSSFIFPNK